MVGVQKTIIRDCTAKGILELNLYIDVLSNSHPDFVEEIETSFTLTVGQNFTYKLPKVEDADENDTPVVVIDVMEAQEDKYPPFLNFENDTNTIIMRPDSLDYQGRTYYFTIIVKEEKSDSVKYPYYCTVKLEGDIIEVDNSIVYTDINYTINYIDEKSTGSMLFTSPINMTFMENNFYDMFNIYWRDTTYRENKLNHTLLDFEYHMYEQDNQTINFTMTFAEPYRLGLLIKKSDKLYIEVRDGFNYSGMFLGNATEHRLLTKTSNKRIEMIFDFRNENMFLMRSIAASMYWVMLGIIVLQFVLLLWRGVGLLTVWVLIEYMQLVAFMPIYNFRLIPYLYDAFKPCLISHMIIFDETPFLSEMDDDYFNKNYEYYWLSVGRLSQSFMAIIIFLVIILIANLIVFLMKRMAFNSRLKEWAEKR